ncbi:MAG: 6-phosphogluconolactonase [Pseudomonadota bacterium]
MNQPVIHEFVNSATLADALADEIAEKLSAAIASCGQASLAVSGGSTPKLMFQRLSGKDIEWGKVAVTLVDDRCVPHDDERSNVRLVRENLLQNNASGATLHPLWSSESQDCILSSIKGLLPFDVLILGMGTDGHTASLFPQGSNLRTAANPNTTEILASMEAPNAAEPRITLTLPPIVQSQFLALHIEGDAKRNVLGEAMSGGDADAMPIRHVLRHPKIKLDVYWCP